MTSRAHRNALPPRFELLWYRIEKVLGQGGFGITYLATDTKLGQRVAIKEYMPMELASREADSSVVPITDERAEIFEWGLARFLDEAKTLARFKHPNTVRVLFFTEAHNTGYMIMEYEEGEGLDAIIRRGEKFSESRLLEIFIPLLEGLKQVHAIGFIHRDIKPANIFIRQDGSPVLLDFGAARQAVSGFSRKLTAVVSPGYAPFEQYASGTDQQGPWTDIYALGATLYHAATGEAPSDAISRSAMLQQRPDPLVPAIEIGKGRYSPRFLAAIDAALSFSERSRPRSLEAWQTMLTGGVSSGAQGRTAGPEPEAPGSLRRLGLASLVIVLALATGIFILVRSPERMAGLDRLWQMVAGHDDVPPIDTGSDGSTSAPSPDVAVASDGRRVEIERLLWAAEADAAQGRWVAAAERYQAALALEPDHSAAKAGLENIFVQHLQRTVKALVTKDFDAAARALEDAGSLGLHPEKVASAKTEVEAARAEWGRVQVERAKAEETAGRLQAELERDRLAEEARERAAERERLAEVDALLTEAAGHLAAMRLTSPESANAFSAYLSVLEIDPESAAALDGLRAVGESYRRLAEEAARTGDFAKAKARVERALSVFRGVPLSLPNVHAALVADVERFESMHRELDAKAEVARLEAEREAEAERARKEMEETARLAERLKKEEEDAARRKLEEEQRKLAQGEQLLVEAELRARYEALVREAGLAEDGQDRSLAIAKYGEALALFPDEPVARTGLARVTDPTFGTCGRITGPWRYSTGGLVTINDDGTVKHELVVVFNATGRWECLDPAKRSLKISWSTGFTDFLTLAPGGKRMEGKNHLGMAIWAQRE